MLARPELIRRLGWLCVAIVCFVGSCTFWRQNNWMVYGGAHDYLSIGPLLLTGCGAVGAFLCVVFGPRRFTVALVLGALIVVLPMAINELGWNRQWLVAYPSRLWVYGAIASALAATAVLTRTSRSLTR